MRKTITLTLLTLMLAACATPLDLRKSKAVLDVSSNKPAKQVAICISDGWENVVPTGSVSTIPINTNIRTNGYSITGTAPHLLGQGTVILADIADTSSGSTTVYYKDGWPGYGSYDEIVTNCQ